MFLEIKPSVVFNTHYRLKRIQFYANGAFSLNVERLQDGKEELLFADCEGNILYQTHQADRGIALYNGSYLLLGEPTVNNFAGKTVIFSGEYPNGKVYSKKNEVLSYGFDEFKIFPNGWYMLTYKENKELYTRDNKLVASGFVDCEVLGNGFYAIKMDSIFYKHGNYNIYNGLSKLIAKEDNVVAFFGDKLMLKHSDKQDVYTLENYQKEEIAKNVTGYKKFYNGRFSLTFVNGSSAIYDENGNRLSTYTGPNATFLPDATFFACHQNIIERRYRPNGLMIKEEIFNCEQVSNYFLVTKEKSTELYDETGKIVDTDLLLACSFDNFALFQKKDRYHLYNQFGKVLEFNVY